MRSRTLVIVLLTLALWSHAHASSGNTPVTLRAAVASNFREPFVQLSERYQRSGGDTIRGIFGSSGMLAAQIQQGAPFDIFFSADSERPRDLMASGHTAGTPFTYARGRLALWMPGGRAVDLKNGISGRFAIANPQLAPYGRAARECLRSLTMWEESRPRAVYGNNISQTYHFIASGGVPAGFIAFSQAVAQNTPQFELWLAPSTCHQPIDQHVVGLRSPEPQAVDRFLQFIASNEAQEIISMLGYLNPLGEQR